MRLIDADALKEDLRQYFTEGVLDGISAKLAFHQIMHDIDNAPTVELQNWNKESDSYGKCKFANGYRNHRCDSCERWESKEKS